MLEALILSCGTFNSSVSTFNKDVKDTVTWVGSVYDQYSIWGQNKIIKTFLKMYLCLVEDDGEQCVNLKKETMYHSFLQ